VPRAAERPAASWRWLRLAALLLAIVLLNVAGGWLVAQLDFTLTPINSDMVYSLLLLTAAVYVLVIAMPFVPGIEIGLALLFVLGPAGVPLVYLCNLLALALAFLIGRLIPLHLIARLFGWLRMERARRMIETLASCPPHTRLMHVLESASAGWARRLLLHRHLAAGIVLNLPGNAMIGGAGGIAMIAGMSHLFRFPLFILTMAIASTPVPILILLTG
jgi:hypothetical protein